MLLSILVAIIGLALLIVLHEAGHFLAARLCGMRVDRFSIGFGNPIVSFERSGTVFQIAPIPLGGFVQIRGLNPHEEFDHNDPYVFPNRPRWMRFSVLVAGPLANYLTASVIAIGLFLAYGKPSDVMKVDQVVAGGAAEQAGIKANDVLVEANGKAISAKHPIHLVVRESKGNPVVMKVLRDGQPVTLSITPRKDEASGHFMIGIAPGQVWGPVPASTAIKDAVALPVVASGVILKGMWDMITGREKGSLTGPVGIAREMANAAERSAMDFLQLMMMLSVYLGLFNLLPLPALDGGRILFIGINALRSRELNAKTEAAVHMVGLMLLLGVFVLVTFKDIKDIVVRLMN